MVSHDVVGGVMVSHDVVAGVMVSHDGGGVRSDGTRWGGGSDVSHCVVV